MGLVGENKLKFTYISFTEVRKYQLREIMVDIMVILTIRIDRFIVNTCAESDHLFTLTYIFVILYIAFMLVIIIS